MDTKNLKANSFYPIVYELFKIGWEAGVEYCQFLQDEVYGSHLPVRITPQEAFEDKIKDLSVKFEIIFDDDDGEPQ